MGGAYRLQLGQMFENPVGYFVILTSNADITFECSCHTHYMAMHACRVLVFGLMYFVT